ncbi:MAG: DeoR family transcriptional regulator [Treponemataceae bacterium]
MKLNDRQCAIVKKITAKGSIPVDKLQELFPVSRETLRKDLVLLEKIKLVRRSYGEISFIDNDANNNFLRDLGWLTKSQRRERILNLLSEHKELRISVLVSRLNVTASTVRNDVDALENEGVVIKKHGIVMLESPTIPDHAASEMPAFPLKTRILGQRGLFHINPNETIYLDGSPYSQYIAAGMPFYANIPIATNSLAVCDILRKRAYTSAIMLLPGTVSIAEGEIAISGARSFLASTPIRKAFIAVRSFSNKVFYFSSETEAASAIEICEHAEKIYLFLDSSTIDKKGEYEFPYKKFAEKVQEIMIDDGLKREEASLLFTRKDPVAVCGVDFAYQNVSQRKYRIGFLANGNKNYFIQAVYNSLQEAAAEYKSISFVIRETNGEYQDVIDNCERLFEERIDLLIDYSLCINAMLHIGEKCRSRGIKLIGVDLHVPGSVYFGADNSEAGRIAGENAAKYIRENWNGKLDRLIILGRNDVDPVTNLRISSAVETLRTSVDIPDSAIRTIAWNDPAINPTQELIQELKTIPPEENLFSICFNVRHLMSAHDLIARYRKTAHTIMVGQNYTQQIDELMKSKDSPLIGCVQYDPEGYGAKIMDIAQRMLENHPMPPVNHTVHSWIPNPYRA